MVQEPERLGDFEIVREIGRGGMGVVYEATQLSLNRRVALKVLPPGATPEQRDIERFQREARAAASLDHPNIVPIYAQGDEEGTHYYAMKLVQGRSLNEVVRETREKWEASRAGGGRTTLSQNYFRTAAQLIMEVAEALDYAHSQGVVHRDIKPHNLILTPDDHLVITDFGLARFLSAPSITISGEMVGTPAYMSPEQVQAERQAIDHRTDVYSLGVTLYEMLVLEVPFRADTREALLRQILMKDPPPLRRINPRIPRDLETICLKAIEKDPSRRYHSAKLLAHDLRCFLEGLPIAARPIGPLGRVYRRAKRRKALTAAIAGIFLALVAGAYLGVRYYPAEEQVQRARRQAEQQRLRAEEQERIAEQERLRAEAEAAAKREEQRWNLLRQGRTATASDNYVLAKELFQNAARIKWDVAVHFCFWRLAQRFRDTRIPTLGRPGYTIVSVGLSPDGKILAAGFADDTIKLWDATTGRELSTVKGHTRGRLLGELPIAFSPDSKTLASESAGNLSLWDVATGTELSRWDVAAGTDSLRARHASRVCVLAFSPDGEALASGSEDGKIRLWDVATGRELHTLMGLTTELGLSVAFSPDGKVLASAIGREIALWDVATGRKTRTLKGHEGTVFFVAFSQDGRTLASTSRVYPYANVYAMRLWEAATGTELRVFAPRFGTVTSFACSPDLMTAATGSRQGDVQLWDVAANEELLTLAGAHSRSVDAIAFSSDGRLLASASRDGTVKLWDAARPEGFRRLMKHRASAGDGALSSDRPPLTLTSDDSTVRLRDGPVAVSSGMRRRNAASVSSVLVSADGKVLAFGRQGRDRTPKLWDVITSEELLSVAAPHRGPVSSVAFSPDGWLLASAGMFGVKLWEVPTGGELLRMTIPPPPRGFPVEPSVVFSADGRLLASAWGLGKLKLWEVATAEEFRTLRASRQGADPVSFSADHRHVLAHEASEVKLWEVSTGLEQLTPAAVGHNLVAFSPDGTLLAKGVGSKVKLWEAATGGELLELAGPKAGMRGLVFSPDGTLLASAGGRLWSTGTGEELHRLAPTSSFATTFSPDGRLVALASQADAMAQVELREVATGKRLRTLSWSGFLHSPWSVAFSPDGGLIALGVMFSGVGGGTVKVWDVATSEEVCTLKGQRNTVYSLAWSPDAKLLATGSEDTKVRLWDVATGTEVRTFGPVVTCVALSLDGTLVALGFDNGTLQLRKVATGAVLRTFKGQGSEVVSAAFNPEGTLVASGAEDGTVRLWAVLTGKQLSRPIGHSHAVSCVAFSSDGSSLASATADGTVKLWDVATGREIRAFKGHTGPVLSLAFTRDGEVLAAGSEDGNAKLWNIATAREIHTLKGHKSDVVSVGFNPDGTLLASGSADNTLKVWDVVSGKELITIGPLGAPVASAAFILEGSALACGVGDEVMIYDFHSYDQVIERWLREAGVEADIGGQ